mgnify:FL=1
MLDAEGGEYMSDPVTSFPSTRAEALALLYVQAQDLRDKSPKDIFTIYQSAYMSIRAAESASHNTYWSSGDSK